MKTLLASLLVLSGCGSNVLLEPTQSSSLVAASGPAAPIDCAALCRNSKPQLIRDFGFTDAQVDCTQPEFAAADECGACRAVFG